MNDIFSFYQLISKYQIEIPIIQRDYAQGRNNPKAEDVRKSMVSSMIKSVTEDKSPLFFDFVYGRIDGNKFIPFDGQQRLTTLFLFHKYIFEKCQSCSACHYKSNCICNDILLRFTYATRQSSREFCEQLVSNSVIPSKEYHKKIRDEYLQTFKDKQEFEAEIEKKADEYVAGKTDWMSVFIKNQSWFYSDWEKDPTIMGMLTMLDEIHNQFTKKEINEYKPLAEKLTSGCSCPITYHFVDMGEHKLSDETYVKMNARGKTLTPFENFKASLEQYLEEKSKSKELSSELQKKHKDLLCRLNGGFDESLQKYTGIDGIWLDEFWNLVNKDKEIKEIPDSLMMSFFNRHFMNVWRCWYGNNTKSENERKNLTNEEIEKQKEYDSFNERIVAEMPLYPTKDDFVSWDIYQNILEICGVDNCLTPIFNIWDELCEEQENNIIENSQSVWNRGEGKAKWDLYEGTKNNVNRETYPSRVAFYALLRYFGVKEERTTTTLAQWMRIVWNIIENSTIDSSDTYQAALRLMNKLSNKCHNIHDALANDFADFQLGSQYHAQDQVQEEIIKATKIIENTLWEEIIWEEIINRAESCNYLKGKIWVLFQDKDNTRKEVFLNRWNLLVDILNNKDEYYLPKILISYYDMKKPHTTIELKKSENNWKTLLTDNEKGLFSCFQKIQSNSINTNISYQWIKDLSTTQLLNNSRSDAKKVGSYGNSIVLWGTAGCKRYVFANEVWGNVIIGNHRTILVDGNFELQDKNIIVQNTNFVSYFDVNFKYNNHIFQWWGNPNDKELDVYLLKENEDYCERQNPTSDKNTDEDKYFCFRVTKNMSTDDFLKKLDCLIQQACAKEAGKDCFKDCPNEKGNHLS